MNPVSVCKCYRQSPILQNGDLTVPRTPNLIPGISVLSLQIRVNIRYRKCLRQRRIRVIRDSV